MCSTGRQWSNNDYSNNNNNFDKLMLEISLGTQIPDTIKGCELQTSCIKSNYPTHSAIISLNVRALLFKLSHSHWYLWSLRNHEHETMRPKILLNLTEKCMKVWKKLRYIKSLLVRELRNSYSNELFPVTEMFRVDMRAYKHTEEGGPWAVIHGKSGPSESFRYWGSTRKKGTYEVGIHLMFSCEHSWQRCLFQVLQMNKKSFWKFMKFNWCTLSKKKSKVKNNEIC